MLSIFFGFLHRFGRMIGLVTSFIAAEIGLISGSAVSNADPIHRPPLVHHGTIGAPPPFTISPVLLYRFADNPATGHDGLSFWLKGDSLPTSISLYLFASGGKAGAPLPTPGSGKDNEPLWPAWISNPISTDFSGWKNIVVPFSALTYRAPVGNSPSGSTVTPDTADAIGLSSANRKGTIYVSDLVWTNVDANGAAAGDPVVIDSFPPGDVGAWRTEGTPEAIENLSIGVTALADDVRGSKVALKLNYAGDAPEIAAKKAALAKALSLGGKDYLLSVPSSPFERILPESLPSPPEVGSRVSLTACPDQVECGSFALYSQNGMSNVTVHLPSALNGVGKVIPKSDVNISVVKVWKRNGTGTVVDSDSAGLEPELLVKDDRIALHESAGEAPNIRVVGDPATDIPANSEKQFWIDVAVPRNTQPGDYTAQIVISSNEESPINVTLEIDVLPLRLLAPSKQYIIGFKGKCGAPPADASASLDYLASSEFSAELSDIAQHGFHYVSLSDSPDALPAALSIESQFNFQIPIVYPVASGSDGLTTAQAVSKLARNPENFYFLVPSGPTMPQDIAALKTEGFCTAALISSDSDYQQNQRNLDAAIYPVDYPYVQELIRSNGKRVNTCRDWLTWPAFQDNPQLDRLYSGFLLWRSNLYGAYIGDYQGCIKGDPFDDSGTDDGSNISSLRPAMLTYPAQNGVIDTIQWESVREGITDVRYLTTYFTAMRECKDDHLDSELVSQSLSDVTNFLNRDFLLMSDTDYQKGRAMISRYAVQLRQAADHYRAEYPSQ